MTLYHVEQTQKFTDEQWTAGHGVSYRWVVDDESLPKVQAHYSNYPGVGNRWSEFEVKPAPEFKIDLGGMQDTKRPYLYLSVDGARIQILEQQLDGLLGYISRIITRDDKKLACPWARAYWFSAATWTAVYHELQACKTRN